MQNGNGHANKKWPTRAVELSEQVKKMAARVEEGGEVEIPQSVLAEYLEVLKAAQVIADAQKVSWTLLTRMVESGVPIEKGAASIAKLSESGSRSWSNIVKEHFGAETYKALLADETYKPAPALRWRMVDSVTNKRIDG